jgi:hypothetical protein
MGQADSKPKRLTRDQRQNREQMKQNALQQKKDKIQHFQETLLSGSQGKEVIPVQQLTTMLHIGETAKKQLDRGGNGFTKSDLVAILIALEPKFQTDLVQLHELTNSDLTTMIRSIIYDPSRIFQDSTGSSTIEGEHTLRMRIKN